MCIVYSVSFYFYCIAMNKYILLLLVSLVSADTIGTLQRKKAAVASTENWWMTSVTHRTPAVAALYGDLVPAFQNTLQSLGQEQHLWRMRTDLRLVLRHATQNQVSNLFQQYNAFLEEQIRQTIIRRETAAVAYPRHPPCSLAA